MNKEQQALAWDSLPEESKERLADWAKTFDWTERKSYATIDNKNIVLYNVLTDIFGNHWRINEYNDNIIK